VREAYKTRPQGTEAEIGVREDSNTIEILVNYLNINAVADRPITNYVYRAKEDSRELTPLDITKLAPELVCYIFNCNTWSLLS
jgi:hypothetical protein